MRSKSEASTSFDAAAARITTDVEPTLSEFSLSRPEEFVSSAAPTGINIRTCASSLFLLYLIGVFLCLFASGTPGVLSYVVISTAIIAIIGGAEAVAIPDPAGLHYSVGWRVPGLRPAGAAKVRDSQVFAFWNGTHTITESLESARLSEICGEVYCHNWPRSEHETPTLTASKRSLTYAELAKRLSTTYVTVTPTSGIIGIFGPQIIPVTVESTAYENVIVSTIDIRSEERRVGKECPV